MPIGAVQSILGRIEHIEQRFTRADAQDAPREVPSAVPFDPFGEAYQRAVEARSTASAATASAVPTSFATAIPLDAIGSSLSGLGTSSGPGGAGRIGGFGRMPVPAELEAYGNGLVPADALRPIAQSGHRLHAPAAVAWDALVAAAAADGIEVRITDSYRSFDQQVDLAARKGLYREGGLAATPGTSNHGWGLAVDADVRDPVTLDWLRTNGARFGFVEAVPREPWHWEYRPAQV